MKKQPIELIDVKAKQNVLSNLVGMNFIFRNNRKTSNMNFLLSEAEEYIRNNLQFCHNGTIEAGGWQDDKCETFCVTIYFTVGDKIVYKSDKQEKPSGEHRYSDEVYKGMALDHDKIAVEAAKLWKHEWNKVANNQNAKADKGKPKLSLVPTEIINCIARCREYGTKKYHNPDNWKDVEKGRYIDAAYRHWIKYVEDNNSVDEESGLPHLYHCCCNLAFLCEFDKVERETAKINDDISKLNDKKPKELITPNAKCDDNKPHSWKYLGKTQYGVGNLYVCTKCGKKVEW